MITIDKLKEIKSELNRFGSRYKILKKLVKSKL